MRLLHYSRYPLGGLGSTTGRLTPGWKPIGLWVSDEGPDDWAHFCAKAMPEARKETFAVCHEIILKEDHRVLITPFPDSLGEYESRHETLGSVIDWPAVAKEFQGTIITPYSWEDRLEIDWYYGWDCASGCIWDVSAIAEVKVCQLA